MRLPLLQGLPFTGPQTVLDLTTQPDADRVRYVTLYAVNLEPAEATVQASLVVEGEVIALPETRLVGNLLKPRWVLERFPMMGASSLDVVAADGVFCFGFLELEPSEAGSRLEPLAPTAVAVPFTPPNGIFSGDEENVVHVIPDGISQDVSFVLDAPLGASFELRFYRGDELAATLPMQGPLLTAEIWSQIPMQGPAAVRLQIVEVADEDQRVSVYGNMVRR